jgi:hypothetical protein
MLGKYTCLASSTGSFPVSLKKKKKKKKKKKETGKKTKDAHFY